MQINNNIYNNQLNFGFNIQVKKGANLVDINKSEFFTRNYRTRVNKLVNTAQKVFPQKTVILDLMQNNTNLQNACDVNFIVDGEKRMYANSYDAGSILYLLEKASRHLTTTHAMMFYGVEKSPDLIKHGEKIKQVLNS